MNQISKITVMAMIPLALLSCAGQRRVKLETDTDAVFNHIAVRSRMNVLRAGGENLGAFGSVYALLEPATESELYSMAKAGKPIDITPYDSTSLGLQSHITETTNYQIQSQMASAIGADLKAEIEGQGGSVEVFRKKLIDSKIRFKVVRHSTYEREARKSFNAHNYTVDELPKNVTAVLTPLEILVVTDFTHQSSSDNTTEGKFVARFIEKFAADINVRRSSRAGVGVGLTEPRIIAIRPLVLVKRES
jgi:hypothetical protein